MQFVLAPSSSSTIRAFHQLFELFELFRSKSFKYFCFENNSFCAKTSRFWRKKASKYLIKQFREKSTTFNIGFDANR